jgi:hypothetical protein
MSMSGGTGLKLKVKTRSNPARNLAPATVNLKNAASRSKHTNRVKKGGLLKAGLNLAASVANPLNVVKSVKKAVKGEGLVLPGSKYIGPGNKMNLGKPRNRGDALAYQHDKDYDSMLAKGAKKSDVYLGYSNADARALKGAWREAKRGSGGALAVAAGMGLKKLGHSIGLTRGFSKGARKFE